MKENDKGTNFYRVYMFFYYLMEDAKQVKVETPIGRLVRFRLRDMERTSIMDLRDGLRQFADFLDRWLQDYNNY
jgi:hypothetical protein